MECGAFATTGELTFLLGYLVGCVEGCKRRWDVAMGCGIRCAGVPSARRICVRRRGVQRSSSARVFLQLASFLTF
ncbi:hypothetical protein OF83DRAFT_1106744 [Amylostereum chailletii]|nr:hypothetical protein OF83DRAFT_1106744 [Amylostereum chailletii]